MSPVLADLLNIRLIINSHPAKAEREFVVGISWILLLDILKAITFLLVLFLEQE